MTNLVVVIVEYFNQAEVRGCVKQLRKALEGLSYQVVVVSNSGYTETERAQATTEIPGVQWLFNSKNEGFAKAVNKGIFSCEGKTYLIVNSDVEVDSDAKKLLRYMDEMPDCGIVAPRIVSTSGEVQDSCRRFMTIPRLFQRMWHRVWKRKGVVDSDYSQSKVQTVDWVIGACIFIRRELVEKIGGFDDAYFMYVEDMDYCKRCWDAGFQVMYVPDVNVVYEGDRKSLKPFLDKELINRYTIYHCLSYVRFLFKFGLRPKRRIISL